MAKIFEIMGLLEQGTKLAKAEHEQLDLINKIADFCVSSAKYFDTAEFKKLEETVVKSIDYANSSQYNFEKFSKYYNAVILNFIKLKDMYEKQYDEIIMSIAIAYYGNEEDLIRCLDSFYYYPNRNIEIVILNCTDDDMLEKTIDKFKNNNVKCLKSNTKNEIENEILVISECSGIFVIPFYSDDVLSYDMIIDCILMLKNNPQASVVYFPVFGGPIYTMKHDTLWEILNFENPKLEKITNIDRKSCFAFRKDLVDLHLLSNDKELLSEFKKPEDIYNWISHDLYEDDESILFRIPLHKNIWDYDKDGNFIGGIE